MFVNVYALVIGLVGVCWRLALAEHVRATGRNPLDQLSPSRINLPRGTGFRPRRAVS
jgi:hypothetical protein